MEIQENKMGIMPIQKLLINMSLPMMISMLIEALYNVVDSIFVAQINEQALTAVSLAFPVQNLMIAIGVGTGVGMNALLSRSLGERNLKQVNSTANNGIFLAFMGYSLFLVFGAFFTKKYFMFQTKDTQIIEYGIAYLSIVCMGSFGLFNQIIYERLLQSTGKSFYSMIIQGSGAIINIILDPILIFGLLGFPKMGVAGAALATIIGQTTGAILGLYLNLKVNREIKIKFKGFKPNFGIIKKIYAVGLPSIIMMSINSVTTYGLNSILMKFSSTATAVLGIYYKLQSFVFMPIFGLNTGVVPIIAYNYGARKKERIKQTIYLSITYAVALMFIGFLGMQILPKTLLALFNASEEMLHLGVPALRIISLGYVLAGFGIVSDSIYQAFGNGMLSLMTAISRQMVVLLPAAFILSQFGDVNLIWWAYPIAEVVSAVVSVIFLRYIYKYKIYPMSSEIG